MNVTFALDIKCDTVPGKPRNFTELTVRHLVDVFAHDPESRGEWTKHKTFNFRDSKTRLRFFQLYFFQEIDLKL